MLKNRFYGNNLNLKTVVLLLVIFSLVSVSYALVIGINKGDDHKKKETIVTFYSGEHQDKYEAVFSDDELKSLAKNGKLLSKDEMKKYEDLVYDEINNLSNNYKDKDNEDFVFHFNDRKFNEHMKHFSEEMKLFKPRILKELDSLHFNFDTTAFNKQMWELKSQLAPLKNMKIKILKDLKEDFDIPDIEMD